MDEMTTPSTGPAADQGVDPTSGTPQALTGTDDVPTTSPHQPALPQLSFDDQLDEPISYSLTARARREVVPHAVPALRVVDPHPREDADETDLDRPGDTRPSRARALRRGGASLARIAADLEVDELVVRAWVGDVGARLGRRSANGGSAGTAPAAASTPAPSVGADDAGEIPVADRSRREQDDTRVGFELARAAARAEVHARLGEPGFAAGLGVASSILSVDEHAATLTTSDLDVAAAAVRWLRQHAGVGAEGLRVVLRLGPDVAGDLARHRWAGSLGLPTDRVLHARWRGAPAGDAVEALIRVPDGATAATLAGWRDAVLADHDGPDVSGTAF